MWIRAFYSVLCASFVASLLLGSSATAQEGEPERLQAVPGAIPLDSQGRPDVGPVRQASRMIDMRVTAGGEELGTVKDLALDLAEGYVALVILKPAKSSADERIALPPYVLSEQDSGLVVSDKVTPEMLTKLERLSADNWQEKANRLWACQLYSEFALRAPWEDRRGGTWGGTSTYCQLYDRDRLKTIQGTIEKIEYVAPQADMALGTQLVVATDEGLRNVQLGPLWFLSRGNIRFARGEEVTVRGSEVELDGNRFLMAATVQRGDRDNLELRTQEGEVKWPDWSDADDMFSFAPYSAVRGTPIQNLKGKDLGTLADLAIGAESGLIAYAAIDNPQVNSDAYLPVPLSAFVVRPGARAWIMELPEDIFAHTPTVPHSEWPEQIDRSWVEYVHVRYGRSPFGGVRQALRTETHEGEAVRQSDRASS